MDQGGLTKDANAAQKDDAARYMLAKYPQTGDYVVLAALFIGCILLPFVISSTIAGSLYQGGIAPDLNSNIAGAMADVNAGNAVQRVCAALAGTIDTMPPFLFWAALPFGFFGPVLLLTHMNGRAALPRVVIIGFKTLIAIIWMLIFVTVTATEVVIRSPSSTSIGFLSLVWVGAGLLAFFSQAGTTSRTIVSWAPGILGLGLMILISLSPLSAQLDPDLTGIKTAANQFLEGPSRSLYEGLHIEGAGGLLTPRNASVLALFLFFAPHYVWPGMIKRGRLALAFLSWAPFIVFVAIIIEANGHFVETGLKTASIMLLFLFAGMQALDKATRDKEMLVGLAGRLWRLSTNAEFAKIRKRLDEAAHG